MGFGNNSAANAATAQQQAQQQQIQSAVSAINSAYSTPARQAQYSDYYNNLLKQYTTQVNNQQQVNARDLKFAEARSGLAGGSANVDANTQLQKDYTQGLIQASQQAQGGQAALENADINSKNALIGLAEQGNYTGSVGTQIAQAMNTNLTGAANYAPANALGNLFAGTSQIYNNEQTAAANRRAQINPIGSLYGGTNGGATAFGG